MAGAIEDLVVQVGKLSTRKPEENQEEPSEEEAEAVARARKLEFYETMVSVHYHSDALQREQELFEAAAKHLAVRRTELDVVQAKGAAYIAESLTRLCDPLPFPEPIRRALINRLSSYTGTLSRASFMEMMLELPGTMTGLIAWLQRRPQHAHLLRDMQAIMNCQLEPVVNSCSQALPPSPGALPQSLLPHTLAAQHYMSNTGPANGSPTAVTDPAHSSPTTESSDVSIGPYPTPASSHDEELPASPAATNGSQPPTLQQTLEYLPYCGLLVPGQIAQPPPPPALGCAGTPRKTAFPPQAGSPLPTPDERARGTPCETALSSEPDQDQAIPAQALRAQPPGFETPAIGNGGQNVVEETDSESGSQAGAAEEDTHLPKAEPSESDKPPAAEQSLLPEQLPLEGGIHAEEKAGQDKMRWADEMDKGEEGEKKEKKDKRGRKARAGANKRASASSRIPVPGAEFAEEAPVPRGSSIEPQHAKPAAKTPADVPVVEAPAPAEDSEKDFRDGSVYDGDSDYGRPRSEASQDYSAFHEDHTRPVKAPGSEVLSDAQDHAEVEAEKKKDLERLDALRGAWGDCRQLFAGNLGSHATETALMMIFRDYNIVHVKLCKERGFFGEPYAAKVKGYGFLTFKAPEDVRIPPLMLS
ncbi:hypothetical protein COCSUDRAFT_42807 [Coccomyxa subellipsoidea C-169]|uniref:RRM domain-containing protein n=1 Tax=Coccomyxa subellipsoidea (strain C-169) TaxID=574566 RepID=I0YTM6_COCSC|nr:hypothetical protein COCSUDRAFT_42807 [Coccomyxa subellipsoidea C-169]EIE21745.1 hypothetical protein COCSUDRAFT_42807 [Coccomyxa subellipsoidea C-169]|eukprot:XP_005646289.1 hypothetical protein COCSUDRAFT_42807 [Coccomyxa subellipsoidea C-169]